MPELARNYRTENNYYFEELTQNYREIPQRNRYYQNISPIKKQRNHKVSKIKKQQLISQAKPDIRSRLASLSILIILGLFVLPSAYKNISNSIFTKSPYPNIKTDYERITFPTVGYLNNNLFLNNLSLNGANNTKKAAMLKLNEAEELTDLESSINNLAKMFPTIHSSVFVWDYDTGNYANINGDETFSAASIIKIPVLLQLFRAIEAGQTSLYEQLALTDYFRAEGSGSLQFKAENSTYTIDTLARLMITDSDNSATNMIMSKIGSMVNVNQGIRDWGLKNTQIKAWLPDLEGHNYSTAKDLATMLYNIDNSKFLSDSSRTKIIDYMSHVKNNRLIQAGLGDGAFFMHKTGDIGKMLGDAGIVTTPNGKKYVVVILANRPYNSAEGKDFIVKASEIIYNYMVVK